MIRQNFANDGIVVWSVLRLNLLSMEPVTGIYELAPAKIYLASLMPRLRTSSQLPVRTLVIVVADGMAE